MGLGATSVLVAVDLAVFTLVTCLALKLGYPLESLGESKKIPGAWVPLQTLISSAWGSAWPWGPLQVLPRA